MLAIFQNLLQPKSNMPEAAKLLVDLLNVKLTKTTLTKEIEEHPDYPSLLSISDVLNNYGVNNLAINLEPEKLGEVPVPFIAPIRAEKSTEQFFTVISVIKKEEMIFYDPERYKWRSISRENFLKRFPGTVLLADVEEQVHAGEKDYAKILREEKKKSLVQQLIAFCIPAIVIISGIATFIQNGTSALLPFIFSLFTLTGAVIGVLLLWYELDQYNPALRQICSAGKKINCSAILHSKASKIAGISWSAIGFAFFMGQLLLLLFNGVDNPQILNVISWLNVLALPYVFFSVYYQWRVAKQWCVLCLCVQALLILQFIVALAAGWHALFQAKVFIELATTIIAAFAIPFIAVTLLMPALQKAKESRNLRKQLQRLKYNPQIFQALLAKQKAVTGPVEGLGISLGNPNGKYKLIKVCNPYCWPCAKAHVPVEELLENNPDVHVQIIFNATNTESDIRVPPVKHLLAVTEMGDEEKTKQALNDWYLPDEKDYETFAAKHPVNAKLHKQDIKIEVMSNWCNNTGIEYTPTFFVSLPSFSEEGEAGYHQLPSMYSVTDLKYFLT